MLLTSATSSSRPPGPPRASGGGYSLLDPEATAAASGHRPGPSWSSGRYVTLGRCRKEQGKQGVSGCPLPLYTRPGPSTATGRRQQEARWGGQAERVPELCNIWHRGLLRGFPSPPSGRRLPFSPICESGPRGSASVFLAGCLSQPRPRLALFSSVGCSVRGCTGLRRKTARATKCYNLARIPICAPQLMSRVILGKCLCCSESVSLSVSFAHLKKRFQNICSVGARHRPRYALDATGDKEAGLKELILVCDTEEYTNDFWLRSEGDKVTDTVESD